MKIGFARVRTGSLPGIATVLVLTVVMAACGGSSSSGGTSTPASTPSATAAGATVVIQNFSFTPHSLTVKPGTKVTWTNDDSVPHNVVSTKSIALNTTTTSVFASTTLSPGQSFSFTFSAKGVYFYECSIHKTLAAMHAVVTVK